MRVLAITGNASLVVALGSMMRDWEVVNVRDVDEAAGSVQGAVVALIDSGDTSQGVEVADKLYRGGITIPCVIIGDVGNDHPRASILIRPFSLEDLGTAVKVAAERGPAPAADSSPVPATPDEPPVTTVTHAPPAERASTVSSRTGAPAAAVVPAPAPEPEKEPSRRGGLSVVRPEPEVEERPAEEEAGEEEPLPDATVDAEPIPEPVETPTRTTADYVRSPLEEAVAPEPPAAPTPAQRESFPPPAPAARFEAPSQAEPAQPSARWRRKRRPQQQTVAAEAESPLVRRLRAAASWAREVESLLEELPVLQDLWNLADALVGEIETQFSAQVTSVFARGEDGYQAVAHRGLSRVEAGMVVPESQPLFSDVISTQEGILIQPVDLAQGLVAGIGGARTEAMMAAPVIVDGQCIAIVVVGGERFAEVDLDRLSDLATEAAPGLAVALVLQRLSGRGVS